MRKTIIYYILGAVSLAIMAGCGGKGSESLGPAEVTEAFMKAVAAGKFDQAAKLCDGEMMNAYIGDYEKVLSKKAAADSTAASIATGILSEIEVTVTEVTKAKDIRTVFYTITDAYGNSKEKIATIKDVEGEWKVSEIRDRN
jgi:hypothetical protein